MEIVDAIKGVDFVTSFDEPTAHSIVCDLLPDVHTKGDGYSAETLPEYEFITNLGIRVVFIHGSPAHSSSTLKETIRNQNQ
jgi:bifunctional ADP-heptose synthase (sugar kinase/adenylyltransferase)